MIVRKLTEPTKHLNVFFTHNTCRLANIVMIPVKNLMLIDKKDLNQVKIRDVCQVCQVHFLCVPLSIATLRGLKKGKCTVSSRAIKTSIAGGGSAEAANLCASNRSLNV